ncbi:MAG: YicC family protein [Gammaproteobacteria bacterium]
MISSMTAFARQEHTDSWGTLTLELRSVNHRYLDLGLRLPDELRVLEGRIREQLQNRLNRGKVDIQVRYQPEQHLAGELQLDTALIEQLAAASDKVKTYFPEHRPISTLEVMRWPGVLQLPQVEPEVLHNTALTLLDQAIDELIRGRRREGEKLKAIIEQRCQGILDIVQHMRQLIPEIKQGWRDKLHARLGEARGELEPGRLEQEIVILAQKVDVDEELDRLETHVTEVRRGLTADKPIGRRLDFLMQELNREANTLGSKSVDARTGTGSVDLKVFIEQMREQVQNVE